jgi:hypothetical protein
MIIYWTLISNFRVHISNFRVWQMHFWGNNNKEENDDEDDDPT